MEMKKKAQVLTQSLGENSSVRRGVVPPGQTGTVLLRPPCFQGMEGSHQHQIGFRQSPAG